MPYAELDQVTLYYELSGPDTGDPMVLIHGNGAQMIAWYPGFVELIEDQGFHVLRFDNRDAGLSEKFEGRPYALGDMVEDVAKLMDHVGFDRAHIVGQSMGGMIAQQFAVDHEDRAISLTSIYSAPAMEFIAEDPEVLEARAEQPARDRDHAIEQYIRRERLSGLDGFTDEWIREFAASVVARDWTPEGGERQAQAMRTAPDRTPALAKLTIPAAVIHGRDDRLVSFEGGIATAQAIPGAELHVLPDMGHQVAPAFWPDFVRILVRNRERSAAVRSASV